MVVVKVIYPFCSKWIEKVPYKFGNIFTWISIILMILNMGISYSAILRQASRQKGIEAKTTFSEWLDRNFPDEKIYKVFENMKPAQKNEDKEKTSNNTSNLKVTYQVNVNNQMIDSGTAILNNLAIK